MSLLNVTVKRGKVSSQQHGSAPEHPNTFVILKLENVKSTSTMVKGQTPVWNQEFLFETNKISGIELLVELWDKGMLWDSALGYKLISIDKIFQGQLAAATEGTSQYPLSFNTKRWFTMDAALIVDAEPQKVLGTKTPTPYMLFLDLRWELANYFDESHLSIAPENYYDSSQGGQAQSNTTNGNYYDYQQYNINNNNNTLEYQNDYNMGYDAQDQYYEYGPAYDESEEPYGTEGTYYSDLQPPCGSNKSSKQLPQIPSKNVAQQVDHLNHNNYYDENAYQDEYYLYENPVCQIKNSLEYDDEYDGGSTVRSSSRSTKKQLPVIGSSGVVRSSQLGGGVSVEVAVSESDPLSYNSRPFQNIDVYSNNINLPSSFLIDNNSSYLNLNLIATNSPADDFSKINNIASSDSFYDNKDNTAADSWGDWRSNEDTNYGVFDRNFSSSKFNQRSVGKRKMLPQIPNRPLSSAESLPPSSYVVPKSLPATPSSSALPRSRQLPTPAIKYDYPNTTTSLLNDNSSISMVYSPLTSNYLPTSTTTSNFTSNRQDFYDVTSIPQSTAPSQATNTAVPHSSLGSGLLNLNKSTSSSLISDMKSLFSKSTSILPSLANTLHKDSVPNSSVETSTSIPFTSGISTMSIPFHKEVDTNFDFMKSNKFEEGHKNDNNLNYNKQDQNYCYDTYTDQMEANESPYIQPYAKKLPVPAQQQPQQYSTYPDDVISTTASAVKARNFFQSQNNSTFRSTVDQYIPDENDESTDMQQVWMDAVTKSNIIVSQSHSIDTSYTVKDLDEKDYIANGDIRLKMSYYDNEIKDTIDHDAINNQQQVEDGLHIYKTDNYASASHLMGGNNESTNPMNNNLMMNDATNYDYGGKSESSHTTYSKPNLKNMDSFPSEEWTSGNAGLESYDDNQTTYNSGYYNGSTHLIQDTEYDHYQDSNMMMGYEHQPSTAIMSQGTESGQTKAYEDGIMGTSLEGIEELDEYEKDEQEDSGEFNDDDDEQYNDDDYYIENGDKNKSDMTKQNQNYYGKNLTMGYKEDGKEFYDIIEEETIEVDENEDEELNELIKEPITTVSSPALSVPATTTVVTTANSMSLAQNGIAAILVPQTSALVVPAKTGGITATLATSISNTITTTITGSPSIIIEQGGSFAAGIDAHSNDNNNNSFSFNDKGVGQNGSNLPDAAGKMGAKSGVNAKQKWHWAYNKIIMQLNVSTVYYPYKNILDN